MKTPSNIAVLMYHHVSNRGGSLTVAADQFESQMRGLAESGFQSLKADEFAAYMAGGAVPPKSIVITFDDGYLDNWVHAHPVLERYGLTALMFVVTGLVGEGPARPHQGQGGRVPVCPPHHEAKRRMFSENPDPVMVRWDEIDAMVAAGTFEMHSHTHTHRRWDLECASAQEKLERMHEDLELSRSMLTQRLGKVSSHLCWPQGYFEPDYKRLANDLGFHHLYTTDARGQNMPGGDVSHIYRFAVRNRRFPWLRRRLWLATHRTWGPLYNSWKSRGEKGECKGEF